MAMARLISNRSNYYKESLHDLDDNNSQSNDFQWQITEYYSKKCLMFSGNWLSPSFLMRNYFGQLILNCSQCRWKLTLILQENVGVDGNSNKIPPGALFFCKYKHYNQQGKLLFEKTVSSKNAFCETAEKQELSFTWLNSWAATVVVECLYVEETIGTAVLDHSPSTPSVISSNKSVEEMFEEERKQAPGRQLPSENYRFNHRRYLNPATPYNLLKIVGAAPAYY